MRHEIRIGTLAGKDHHTAAYIASLLPLGFESFEINFWERVPEGLDLKRLAEDVRRIIGESGTGATVSALGIYGNPLEKTDTAKDWKRVIDAAPAFGADCVVGFTGCLDNQPVPDSIKPWKKLFAPLIRRAADKGLRIAFENCPMGSTRQSARWNLAYCPAACRCRG